MTGRDQAKGAEGAGVRVSAPRVTQLDAVELDEAAFALMQEQLDRAGRLWALGGSGPAGIAGTAWVRMQPEIRTLLHLVLCKFSLVDNGASVGQQLLGLGLPQDSSRDRALALALALVLPRWLQARLPPNSTMSQVFSAWQLVLALASCANRLLFLHQGAYPTLPHRLLCLQPRTTQPRLAISVGYNYLVRELVWHGFLDLLSFLLPLVNFHRLRNIVRHILAPSAQGADGEKTQPHPLALAGPLSDCSVCSQPLVLPVLPASCGHPCCYYCAQANSLADPSFACPLCGSSSSASPPVLLPAVPS